jgi:hypothetical protein
MTSYIMKNKIFFLGCLCLTIIACNNGKAPKLAPEYLFTPKDEQVISSIINNKNGTIAIVFGNNAAVKSAGESKNTHFPGERFTMITWKQKPMPHWYGTHMNGEIFTIETVAIVKGGKGENRFRYHAQPQSGYRAGNQNEQQRIKFIISRPAAVFP